MAFSAWYSIVVGIGMLAQWGLFLGTGQVPELQTEPLRIYFHLAGEALTAFALIFSGVGLIKQRTWGREVALFAHGLLFYTVVVSPGYFAQTGEWPLVAMFGVILVLGLQSVAVLMRGVRRGGEGE